jgi:hypothetical protein
VACHRLRAVERPLQGRGAVAGLGPQRLHELGPIECRAVGDYYGLVHLAPPVLFTRHASFGPSSTRLAKQSARALSSLPLEPADVWMLQGTVNDFVLGHSLRVVAPPAGRALADAISPSDVVEFPELASLQENLRDRSSADRFELALQTVLDGVERRFVDPKRKAR